MAYLERQHSGYSVRRLPSGTVCATARNLAACPWCVVGTLGEVRSALRKAQ